MAKFTDRTGEKGVSNEGYSITASRLTKRLKSAHYKNIAAIGIYANKKEIAKNGNISRRN